MYAEGKERERTHTHTKSERLNSQDEREAGEAHDIDTKPLQPLLVPYYLDVSFGGAGVTCRLLVVVVVFVVQLFLSYIYSGDLRGKEAEATGNCRLPLFFFFFL